MTKYLNWKFNLDEEPEIEPYDPLGTITIVGDVGRLEDDCIFLDTFLEAIVKGLTSLERNKIIAIDTIDEPDDLLFEEKEESLTISYGLQKVVILDKNQFFQELKTTINDFLNMLDDVSVRKKQKHCKLKFLRDFRLH